MRRYLIDHARGRPDVKFVGLDDIEKLFLSDKVKLDVAVTVDRLLEQLAEFQPAWCTLVEMKYFLGLTDEEASEMLGMKLRSTQRMWRDARQWLFERMESGDAQKSAGR